MAPKRQPSSTLLYASSKSKDQDILIVYTRKLIYTNLHLIIAKPISFDMMLWGISTSFQKATNLTILGVNFSIHST